MFFDPTESILLVLFRHLDEVTQAFLEFFRSFSRAIDEADADAFVGIGKFLKVFPGFLVGLDLFQDIFGDLKFLACKITQCFTHLFDHLALLEKLSQPFLIGGRIRAFWLARREPLRCPLLIQRFHRAVDPAETQRLLDRVVVLDARLARLLFVIDQPDVFFGPVMLAQPRPPFLGVCDVECFCNFHFRYSNHSLPRLGLVLAFHVQDGDLGGMIEGTRIGDRLAGLMITYEILRHGNQFPDAQITIFTQGLERLHIRFPADV